jgi:uncharacterized protein (DUF342 family)
MTDAVEFSSRDEVIFARVASTFSEPLPDLVALVRQTLPGIWIDWVAVREAYLHGRERPFPIGSRRPEAAQDGKAKIRFSADGLEAYLICYPPKPRGHRITETDILVLLEAYGVPPGLVDRHALRVALTRRADHEPAPVARGRPPIDGRPSWVRWHKGLPSDPRGFLADLDELGQYPDEVLGEVAEGEEVGERHSPGEGTPGLSVSGNNIPARPGRDAVDLGEGLRISPDGRTVVAARGGQLKLAKPGGTSAEVVPLLVLRDVQELQPWSETVYPGSLLVHGDLEVPFPLRILGDVEVRGSVVRTRIEVMGSLFVRGGVIQHRGTPIRVGGVISAAFFERAWVTAHSAHIRTHALKSRILALDGVFGPQDASLHGGQVAAGRSVQVGSLGSRNAMPTEVAVGVPTSVEDFAKLYRGWADALVHSSAVQEQSAGSLEEAARRWGEAERLPAPDPLSAKVEARWLHPGVTVRIGSASRQFDTLVGPVELAYEQIGDRGRISMTRL